MIFSTLVQEDWWMFPLVAVGYTLVLPFLTTDPIVSTRNAKSISHAIRAHVVFLAVILGLTWLALDLYPSLPGWLTDPAGRGTWFGYLCAGIVLVIGLLERKGIYMRTRKLDPQSGKNRRGRHSRDEDPT
jgi:hypothetical protein